MGFDAKAFLATLTDLPGVYRMLDTGGNVLYVGKAKNLKKRVASYFRENLASPRIAHMVSQIAAIETTATRTEAEALLLENNLIKSLAPRYNILFRDDKSYPYIVLSKNKFPRLGFFRGNPDRKADYFGPYPSSWAVRDSIHLLQKMFRLRTCEDTVFSNRSRPCLLYQIKRCSGPCVGLVSPDDYAADVQLAAMFLNGKQQEVTRRLNKAMEEASARLAFEQAAIFRDQIQSLHQVQEKQFVSSSKGEDIDILVAIREAGQLCVNLAMVRGGRHLGDRPFFPTNAGDSDSAEACAAFIRQHYAVHPAPTRILAHPLPAEDEQGEAEATLAELAGRPVPMQEARGLTHKAWINMALQNARLAVLARNQATAQQEQRLAALQDALQLAEPISRIECFDISHTMGEATVASCVVYEGNRMKKSDYRRFNIQSVTNDDYGAMKEALTRRFQRYREAQDGELHDPTQIGKQKESAWAILPDLLIVDGGKGQLAMAVEVLTHFGLTDEVPLAALAKQNEELFVPTRPQSIYLPRRSQGLYLVQRLRDEAHRFANEGHRKRRAKVGTASILDEIPGVGPKRRKALLTHFENLEGIRRATVEELTQVAGISPDVASSIKAHLP